MPKCSSSTTTSGAFLHMYSIASWSPSQSEPFTVSYMCQCQLSSSELPSEAATPPCAATVCERVGKTLESTATFRSARASSSAARKPEPPPPTITASKLRTGNGIETPHYLDRPRHVAHERADRDHVEHEAQAGALDVIHEDVAHPYPRMEVGAQEEQQRGVAHRRHLPQGAPVRVVDGRQPDEERQDEQRVDGHHHGGHALREPVAQAVVGADDLAFHHRSAPNTIVRNRLTPMTPQLV